MTAAWSSATLALLLAAAGLAFALAHRGAPSWLIWGATAQVAACISTALSGVFLGVESVRDYNRLNLINVATPLLALMTLVALGNRDLGAYLAAWVVGQYAGMIWALRRVRDLVAARERGQGWGGLSPFFRFAAVTSVANLAAFLNWRIDTLIVAALQPRAQLGQYAVAVQGAESLWLVSSALSIAVYGRLGVAELAQSAALAAKSMRHIAFILLIAAAILFVGATAIIHVLFGSAYVQAAPVLRILAIGVAVSGVVSILATFFIQVGRPQISLLLATMAATLTALLSFALVPRMGIQGAAIATSVGYAAQVLVGLTIFQRSTHMHWRTMLVLRREDLEDYARLRTLVKRVATRT